MAREKQGERLMHLRCLAAMAKHAAVFIILAGCQRGQCNSKKQQEKNGARISFVLSGTMQRYPKAYRMKG
jgi:hypothetical protein